MEDTPARDRPQVRVFRELLRAHAWVTNMARLHVAEATGLSMSEFDMVAELGNQTGLRMGDLAAKMVVSPANATRVAQALEQKGLVERRRAEHSDREVLARLSPAGDELFRTHFPGAVKFMAGLIDGELSTAEQRTLAELLARLGGERKAPGGSPRGGA